MKVKLIINITIITLIIKIGVPIASLQTILTKTIRHHNCTIVTSSPDKRCITCNNFRKTLFALHHKVNNPKSTNKTFASHRFLTDTKKNQSLTFFFRKENRFAEKADMKLEKFDSYAETNCIAVDDSTTSDIIKIMNEHNAQISATYSANSFQKLFWDSQLKAVTTPKKLIRWHPSIIKWCIYLRNKSSSAYESVRKSGIYLPSQRTLRDYTHFYKSTSGFSFELDLQIIRESKVHSLSDFQKEVCLVADEMHIKEGLVYRYSILLSKI